jgi:hypothetical protein
MEARDWKEVKREQRPLKQQSLLLGQCHKTFLVISYMSVTLANLVQYLRVRKIPWSAPPVSIFNRHFKTVKNTLAYCLYIWIKLYKICQRPKQLQSLKENDSFQKKFLIKGGTIAMGLWHRIVLAKSTVFNRSISHIKRLRLFGQKRKWVKHADQKCHNKLLGLIIMQWKPRFLLTKMILFEW